MADEEWTIDLYVKQVIGAKTKLDVVDAINGSRKIIKQVTHADFKDVILPAIQRAALR